MDHTAFHEEIFLLFIRIYFSKIKAGLNLNAVSENEREDGLLNPLALACR